MALFDHIDWRQRALVAETQLEAARAAVAAAADAPRLIGIEQRGRVNRFTFMRGDRTVSIETYGTLNDTVSLWRRELLE